MCGSGAAVDVLDGGAGNDYLFGGLLDDTLHGGADNDIVRGSDGNDTLFGDQGHDVLDGSIGNDSLFGGDGDDILRGQNGADQFDGGPATTWSTVGPGTTPYLAAWETTCWWVAWAETPCRARMAPTFLAGSALREVGDVVADFTTGVDKFEIDHVLRGFDGSEARLGQFVPYCALDRQRGRGAAGGRRWRRREQRL